MDLHTIQVEGGTAFMANAALALRSAATTQPPGPTQEVLARLAAACEQSTSEATTGDLAGPLDTDDLMLMLHIIDFALEHDRIARDAFGTGIAPDARLGIKGLRAKIRGAL